VADALLRNNETRARYLGFLNDYEAVIVSNTAVFAMPMMILMEQDPKLDCKLVMQVRASGYRISQSQDCRSRFDLIQDKRP
jgi:hypothetical protein